MPSRRRRCRPGPSSVGCWPRSGGRRRPSCWSSMTPTGSGTSECLDALAELIGHLPDGCVVALASREPVSLPFPRWRARGLAPRARPGRAGDGRPRGRGAPGAPGRPTPRGRASRRLVRRTEGWPALLALAALAGDRSPPGRPVTDARVDRSIADYLRSELLAHRTADEMRFLTHTSILERLSGPLCDAVVGRHGSGALLGYLARSTLLVDEYGGWFRYHSLLREVLQDELAIREPETVAGGASSRRSVVRGRGRPRQRRGPRVRGGRRRDRGRPGRQGDDPLPLVGPAGHHAHLAGALQRRRPAAASLAGRPRGLGDDVVGRPRQHGALRGPRRARLLRGPASRRHGILRVRPRHPARPAWGAAAPTASLRDAARARRAGAAREPVARHGPVDARLRPAHGGGPGRSGRGAGARRSRPRMPRRAPESATACWDIGRCWRSTGTTGRPPTSFVEEVARCGVSGARRRIPLVGRRPCRGDPPRDPSRRDRRGPRGSSRAPRACDRS